MFNLKKMFCLLLQEQIDAIVQDKILDALCGATVSGVVKVSPRPKPGTSFSLKWQHGNSICEL